MIKNNSHKYSVSAMCSVLCIPRSTYYYKEKASDNHQDQKVTKEVCASFVASRSAYGTRRIKADLHTKGYQVSRRKISAIMKSEGLVSVYTKKSYKPTRSKSNEAEIGNKLNREFNNQKPYAVIVSDLTYAKVGTTWQYVCLMLDLHDRKIVGHSAGRRKDAELVKTALSRIQCDLRQVGMFHTDRGKEFDNKQIEEALETFGIERSLSRKGCPYDNAVAEATFKSIKTEFINEYHFKDLEELEWRLAEYIHWYNHHRRHSALGYMSPVAFEQSEK